MTKKGILPKFVFVLFCFIPYPIFCAADDIDFPQLRAKKDDENYQVYRTPQSFQLDSVNSVAAEDDITKNDSIVVFDKSKPKSIPNDKVKSDEYIAPQRFEINHSYDGNSMVSAHDTKQHQPSDSNQVNATNFERYDNFGERYQHWNETLFHQAQKDEKVDTSNYPYPPIPISKQKDEAEYFPPSFREAFPPGQNAVEKQEDQQNPLQDSTRTTVPPNSSNRDGFEDISDPAMEDYDKNGQLAKGEEIQYSDDPSQSPTKQTYSTEGIQRDPTMPFKVTQSLMEAMGTTTLPTTYVLQDSEATIHPTLVPGRSEDDDNVDGGDGDENGNTGEEAMITSDYISNMEPSQRDRMFSRDNLQPWERHRNEVLEDSNQEHFDQGSHSTAPNTPESSTYVYPKYIVPASSIYAAPPPPLSSFILVPAGTKYYGDQAPTVKIVSESAFGGSRGEEDTYEEKGNSDRYKIKQHKISRENTVTVEKVDADENSSDLSRSPQFKLYGIKTAFHKGSGTSVEEKPKVESFNTWLGNPATIFDIPLPTVLKTAFAVNSKAFAAKAHSDNSKLGDNGFELDESGNQLKYQRKGTGRSTEIRTGPLQEIEEDFQVISEESDGEEPEVESYIDETAVEAAKKDACKKFELSNIAEEGNEMLSKCFVIAKNCLLTNAAPIERRINLNLTECAQFCAENPSCKSVGYSETMAICDIFAFQNGSADSLLLRYRGTHYLQPTRKNIKQCLQNRRLSGITVVASNDPIIVRSEPSINEQQLLSLTSKVNSPNVRFNSCPADTDILTFKTEGYRLRNFGIDKIAQSPPNSESECIFACLIDIANGRLPFNCTSVDYNSREEECILYSGGSNVKGNGHLSEAKNYAHYEKACADDKLVQQCRGFPVDRIPQHILIESVVSREKASSLLECVSICYERFKNHADCLSVNYYYTEEEENCILCAESHQTIPEYFIAETEVYVDYASIDKCLEIKENLMHVGTTLQPSEPPSNQKSLAIDMEDGSRILPSTPGFEIAPTIDEKKFEINAIENGNFLLSSNDEEIRRHPSNFQRFTSTTTETPQTERDKLKIHLKKSIKRLKL